MEKKLMILLFTSFLLLITSGCMKMETIDGDSTSYVFQFNSYDPAKTSNRWNDISNILDDDPTTYTSISSSNYPIWLDGSDIVIKGDNAEILNVCIQVYGFQSSGPNGRDSFAVIPVFNGILEGDLYSFTFPQANGINVWYSPVFNITYDINAPTRWTWDDLINLDLKLVCTGGPTGSLRIGICRIIVDISGVYQPEYLDHADGTPKYYQDAFGSYYAAQTFTPDDDIILKKIDLYMNKGGGFSTLNIQITKTQNSDPVKSSTTLGTGELTIDNLNHDLHDIEIFSSNILHADTTYAIIISSQSSTNQNGFMIYRCTNVYTGGSAFTSNDNGFRWSESENDLIFHIYGEKCQNNPPLKPQNINISVIDKYSVSLKATVFDPDNDYLHVTFYNSDNIILGTVDDVISGSNINCSWDGLIPGDYSWFIIISDGSFSIRSDDYIFHIAEEQLDNPGTDIPNNESTPGFELLILISAIIIVYIISRKKQ